MIANDETEAMFLGGIVGMVAGSGLGTLVSFKIHPLSVPLGAFSGAYAGFGVGAVVGLMLNEPLDRIARAREERRAQRKVEEMNAEVDRFLGR